jgi:hypothetical protein
LWAAQHKIQDCSILFFLQTMVAPLSDYDTEKIHAYRCSPYTMGNAARAGFGLIPLGAQVISAATPQ